MTRNVSINSVQGACINFIKDRPEFAPEFMRQEIEYRGGEETEAPDPEEPFDVPLVSSSNTSPIVCVVDSSVMGKVKTGDHARLNFEPPKMPIEGTVIGLTLDSFTVEGDMTFEGSPIQGRTATITPSGEEGPYKRGEEETSNGPAEPGAPTDEDERESAMHKAFEQMVLDGRSADDIPSVKDTSTAVGFKVTAAERDDAWASFKAG
jgi:hypothetical protein